MYSQVITQECLKTTSTTTLLERIEAYIVEVGKVSYQLKKITKELIFTWYVNISVDVPRCRLSQNIKGGLKSIFPQDTSTMST